MTADRTPTAVDAVADGYLDDLVALDPMYGTYLGVPGRDDELPDLTVDGREQVSLLRRRTLAALAAAEPVDDADRVTVAALRSDLETTEQLHATGEWQSRVAVIDCPVDMLREIFDLMPQTSDEDWATIGRRMAAVPAAMAGYVATLRGAAARGEVAPRRQLVRTLAQMQDSIGPSGYFLTTAKSADVPDAVRADVQRGAQAASEAYERLAAVVRDELLPASRDHDAVGIERYALHSRHFLGTTVDLEASYHWGIEELIRLRAEMAATAERILPGGTLEQARAALDADPARQLDGTEALREWMQRTSDEAVASLGASHFDIPAPARALRCRIAPSHSGVIYYTGPSADFSRPGQMWWAVPEGDTSFTTWRQKSTVYHEGVPGHHLQIAQTVYRSELLNRWRRLLSWVSGHGEGWALYAERLMAELGYLDDPGDHLGMLEGQSLRAARVIIDIGVHCGFEAPAEVGGGEFTYDKAWRLLRAATDDSESVLRFELDRYLGWPGQAPSYKLGERFWLQLRADAAARDGDAFDLKAFHRRALDVGSLGLDALRLAVLG